MTAFTYDEAVDLDISKKCEKSAKHVILSNSI